MLSCRALRKSYVAERGEVLAVDGIDLDVEAGRYAAIIGVLGVLYPAWRASRRDAYDLVRSGA